MAALEVGGLLLALAEIGGSVYRYRNPIRFPFVLQ